MVYEYLAAGFIGAALTVGGLAAAFWKPFKEVAKHAYLRSQIDNEEKLNCLFIGKSGKVKEEICDIQSDQTVLYKDDKYVVNPNLQYMHHGVPTQIYVEGSTEPLNIGSEELQDKLTTKELAAIMIGSEASEIIALLQKIAPYIQYITYGLLAFMAVILWVSIQNMQVLSELTGQGIGEILRPQ
jgi:hypothetical protein